MAGAGEVSGMAVSRSRKTIHIFFIAARKQLEHTRYGTE
jgi:hypothetical protein